MTILDRIIADKQKEVSVRLASISGELLRKQSTDKRIPLDFKAQLAGEKLSIIAEVKKASPSKGLIRPDFDPESIAKAYQSAGADCLSVLTEEKYFQGSGQYLGQIRKSVTRPLLRKDFIIDKRQIRESYDLGADAILLIVAILSTDQIKAFKALAQEFGLSCLVEVHTQKELETALELQCDLIGVNNRDLTTFQTDINNSIKLCRQIPPSVTSVSESGINTADDCLHLQENGFNAVLVGESLMRQADVGAALINLMSKVR